MTPSTKTMSRIKPVIFIFLLLPSLIWLYQFFAGSLGVNPIDQLIDKSGEFALRLLVLTLLLSSLAQLKYMRSLQMIRAFSANSPIIKSCSIKVYAITSDDKRYGWTICILLSCVTFDDICYPGSLF